jgi:hypothetical protein
MILPLNRALTLSGYRITIAVGQGQYIMPKQREKVAKNINDEYFLAKLIIQKALYHIII